MFKISGKEMDALVKRPILYYPSFRYLAGGSIEAGVLLSYFVGKFAEFENKFFITKSKMASEIGLNKVEFNKALKQVLSLPFITSIDMEVKTAYQIDWNGYGNFRHKFLYTNIIKDFDE